MIELSKMIKIASFEFEVLGLGMSKWEKKDVSAGLTVLSEFHMISKQIIFYVKERYNGRRKVLFSACQIAIFFIATLSASSTKGKK